MTDKTRAELRRMIESLVTADMAGASFGHQVLLDGLQETLYIDSPAEKGARPKLTSAQQLALSVLVGEPDTVIASALADMLIELGNDPTTAAREEGRREERERCASIATASVNEAESYAEHYSGIGHYDTAGRERARATEATRILRAIQDQMCVPQSR